MLKNLTLSSRITAAFLLMGLLIFMISAIGWRVSSRLTYQIRQISDNAFPTTVALWKINEGQTQVQSAERSLLNPATPFENRKKELTRIENAWVQINEGFKEYESIVHTPEADQIYQEVKPLWQDWVAAHQEFLKLNKDYESYEIENPRQVQIALMQQGDNSSSQIAKAKAAVAALTDMNDQTFQKKAPAFRAATDAILKLLNYTNELEIQSKKEAEKEIQISRIWILLALILGPATATIFAIFINKILVRNVQESGATITSSISQIAASGKQLEATVTEQVASTNQVTATAQEIAKTAIQLRKTMEKVASLSEETDQSARDGQEEISAMEMSMKNLADSTNSISNRLGAISERANKINSVVTTITKVADRTNLLSLNAAIEAEKAGEYGKGFSVVSREIRRLADQTAIATLEIEDTVQEMQSAVSAGVMEMDKFTKEVNQSVENIASIGTKLSEIIKKVQTITPRFEKVNVGMENQTESAQQISEAMMQLSEASSQTAKVIKGINDAISGLRTASYDLRQQISVNSKDLKRSGVQI
jgi:methyl-accepting chemotaxis protein WspA